MTYSSNQLQIGVYNAMVPAEGPKGLPVRIDLTVAQTATVDLSQQQALGQLSYIQTMYVDNLDNPQEISFTMNLTRQRLTVPAGVQVYVPILLPNPPVIQVASTGGVAVDVHFLNVPMPMGILGATGATGFIFDGSGNLLVSDALLEANISNPGVSSFKVNNPMDADMPSTATRWFYTSGATAITSGATIGMKAAGGASVFNYIKTLSFRNKGVGLCSVFGGDGGGNYLWSSSCGPSPVAGPYDAPVTITFNPALRTPIANRAIEFFAAAITGAISLDVTATGYSDTK